MIGLVCLMLIAVGLRVYVGEPIYHIGTERAARVSGPITVCAGVHSFHGNQMVDASGTAVIQASGRVRIKARGQVQIVAYDDVEIDMAEDVQLFGYDRIVVKAAGGTVSLFDQATLHAGPALKGLAVASTVTVHELAEPLQQKARQDENASTAGLKPDLLEQLEAAYVEAKRLNYGREMLDKIALLWDNVDRARRKEENLRREYACAIQFHAVENALNSIYLDMTAAEDARDAAESAAKSSMPNPRLSYPEEIDRELDRALDEYYRTTDEYYRNIGAQLTRNEARQAKAIAKLG